MLKAPDPDYAEALFRTWVWRSGAVKGLHVAPKMLPVSTIGPFASHRFVDSPVPPAPVCTRYVWSLCRRTWARPVKLEPKGMMLAVRQTIGLFSLWSDQGGYVPHFMQGVRQAVGV